MMHLSTSAHQHSSAFSSAPARPLLFCLSGGGTGGHVYPALAVAAALNQDRGPSVNAKPAGRPHSEIPAKQQAVANAAPSPPAADVVQSTALVYVGSADGMERQIVARESRLPFRGLPAAALRGRGPRELLRNSATLLGGTQMARQLLAELQPAAILGTGGYVCVPLFLAARAAGIPTLIYLPDVVPGLAVQFLTWLATQIACNVEDSRPHLPAARRKRWPLLVSGYPVRPELFDQDAATCRAAFALDDTLPVLIVYGGSRGARAINRAIQALLPALLAQAQIIHVCGREGDESWLRTTADMLAPELQARYRLFPYLEQIGEQTMARALGAADLAICRSGASTLAELPAVGLPAVLVPYPYVYQDDNADYLVRHGAALKIADAAMLGSGAPEEGLLFQTIHRLLIDRQARIRMAQQSRQLARPDAAWQLAQALYTLAAKE